LIQNLDAVLYINLVESIADSTSHSLPLSLPPLAIYPGCGALLIDYIVEPLTRNSQGCHETNLSINSYYTFATFQEYKYALCGINKTGMKTYYDNILKEEYSDQGFPCIRTESASKCSWLALQLMGILVSGNCTLPRI
jgi:hypothetical protein